MKGLFGYLILPIFLCVSFAVKAMDEFPVFTHYTSSDGLSCNYIHDMCEDESGYIWITTESGLNRFDGYRFQNYCVEEESSLLRNELHHSYYSPEVGLLFGGSFGVLIRYNKEKDCFEDLSPLDFQKTYYKDITGFSLFKDSMTTIASTAGGAYVYNSETNLFECFLDSLHDVRILEIQQDTYGRFWVGHQNGAYVVNAKGERLSVSDELKNVSHPINNILKIDDNNLLLSSTVGSVWQVQMERNGNVSRVEKLDLPFQNTSAMMKDRRGDVWFGTTGNGVWHSSFRAGRMMCELVEPNNTGGDSIKKVTSLFEDSRGIIWIGTQNSGLWCKIPSEKIESLHSLDLGLSGVNVTSFAVDGRGNILMGTDGQGCYLLDEKFRMLKHFTTENGLTRNNVLSIVHRKGSFVISSWGGELVEMDDKSYVCKILPFDGIEKPFYTDKHLLMSRDGRLWCGTSGDGVYVSDAGGRWHREVLMTEDTTMRDYADIWINRICESQTGAIWIITSRTVWRRSGGEWVPLMQDADKTPSHSPLAMNDGTFDERGNLIVATDKGILKFDASGRTYEWCDFLPKGSYSSVYADENGRVWCSGSNGILVVDIENHRCVSAVAGSHFKNKDIFCSHSVGKTKEGYLMFGCKDGFVLCRTDKMTVQPCVERMEWENLVIQNHKQKIDTSANLKLNYDQTNCSLSFSVVDFLQQNNLECEYRILPMDTSWVSLENLREIKLSHLPAGTHRIRVRVIKRGVVIESPSLQLDITVLPPWWQTWWFITLSVVCVLSVIAILVYRRITKLKVQRRKLQKMVDERTKDLSDANLTLQEQKTEIREQNERLEQALKNKDMIVSVVAHDLKNPMFAIVGALDSLLTKQSERGEELPMLRSIYQSANSLQTEMLNLLDWATSNREDYSCHPQDTDVLALVEEVVGLLQGMMRGKGISLTVDAEVLHYAYVDSRMIATVVRNLLTNAIKFSEYGKNINVGVKEASGGVQIIIQDQAGGMTEEQLDQLMQRGKPVSTTFAKNEWGVGLGMQVVKDFVDRNKGTLSVESQAGKGTSFVIDLPMSEQLLAKEEMEVDVSMMVGSSVLLVDDDPLIRYHLREILAPYLTLMEAEDGRRGYESAKQNMPDLIISDIEMPDMDGYEMYQMLQKNRITSDVPLIFLTARTSMRDRLEGLSAGAIDYIPKPFDKKELLLKICNILSWQRKQQTRVLTKSYEGENTESVATPILQQLLEVIRQNYGNPDFSFDDIAKSMGMSKSTLTRRMKTITDKSPVEILAEYRLNVGRRLLKEESYSVSEVAYKVGFNDPLYFSKKYKEAFGHSPSQE